MFKRLGSFCMTITRNLERFLTFYFKTTFLKNGKFFQKTGAQFFY